jgi:hypothetical protein
MRSIHGRVRRLAGSEAAATQPLAGEAVTLVRRFFQKPISTPPPNVSD